MEKSKVVVVGGKDPAVIVQKGLQELGIVVRGRRVVVKPNLITNRPYPVTTPAETVEALIKYFKPSNEVIIAEGSGFGDTRVLYKSLGYTELAERCGIKLVDLNHDEFEILEMPEAAVLKRFEFPQTLKGCYLISAAVLKRHSEARVTLSLKNMLGATIGRDKGRFHKLGVEESIVDINRYKHPDLAVIDGRVGLSSELGGEQKRLGVMIFSKDPVAADTIGAGILGVDPSKVKHLRLAQAAGFGTCDPRAIEVTRLSC
ncbi:MAG: DUF362 domain-containing protein [Hadesarchaea archaeon]|nr:DUF362 domain-containing protein [Hadesarchaea archaeon]